MSERSFCIFRRIHVRLTWASQVAYECFFFSQLVTKTDRWIRTLVDHAHASRVTGIDLAHDCLLRMFDKIKAY